MAYSSKQISDQLTKAREISDRIHTMRSRRVNEECRLAGLGSMGCQLHNSLVSLHYGQPWPEVDYHHARKAKWLSETAFTSNHIIERYYRRMIADWRSAGCP